MAPLLSPGLVDVALEGVEVAEEAGDADKVVVKVREGAPAATIGSTTFLHIEVVLEKTQHESVAFGELAAQYAQSEPVLDSNPQFEG